jgi:hypothetical protein
VEWVRTLRVDAPDKDARADIAVRDGVRIRPGPTTRHFRTYAFVQGPDSVDPHDLGTPDGGRWYGEAIIALAIEPAPTDALPHLLRALTGPGAPGGVLDAAVEGDSLLVDLKSSPAPRNVALRIIDVELRRFNGHRKTQLLTPLTPEIAAAIAADGLQAPEIASDRILESLLGLTNVE